MKYLKRCRECMQGHQGNIKLKMKKNNAKENVKLRQKQNKETDLELLHLGWFGVLADLTMSVLLIILVW